MQVQNIGLQGVFHDDLTVNTVKPEQAGAFTGWVKKVSCCTVINTSNARQLP